MKKKKNYIPGLFFFSFFCVLLLFNILLPGIPVLPVLILTFATYDTERPFVIDIYLSDTSQVSLCECNYSCVDEQ